MSQAKSFIMNSHYIEFPDTLATLELCRVEARIDGRRIGQALRKCAAAIMHKPKDASLRATLETMSTSLFPETQITQIRACIGKMEKELARLAAEKGIDLETVKTN